MDFRKATDELLSELSHEELAKALRVSIPSVRQARLAEGAQAHRSPPKDWQGIVANLAKRRAHRLERLAAALERA